MIGKKLSCCALLVCLYTTLLHTGPVSACGRAEFTGEPAGHMGAGSDGQAGYSIFSGTLVEMTWPEVKKAAEADALVLLPVGVIEEHGPHMSLGVDTYMAYLQCRMLKDKLGSRQVPAVIAPPIYWGIMQTTETGAYPGSFTVQPETMKALIHDVLAALKSWGFRRIYCLNHHGDRLHRRSLAEAINEAKRNLGLEFFEDDRRDKAHRPEISRYRVEKPFIPDYHAGASETGEMLKNFPREVKLEVAKSLKPQSSFHPLGYVGDPANYSNANTEAIDAYLELEANDVARWVKGSPVKF